MLAHKRHIFKPTVADSAAHLCISSRLLASLEAMPSFGVPTRYESHVLSIGFVNRRGQFPLRNCRLSSCEKNTKSVEELIIINYFSRSFHIRCLYSLHMFTRKPRFRALCNQYRCTVGSTVIPAVSTVLCKAKGYWMLKPLSAITASPGFSFSRKPLTFTISLSLILPLYNFETKLKCKIGDIEISNLNVFEDLFRL